MKILWRFLSSWGFLSIGVILLQRFVVIISHRVWCLSALYLSRICHYRKTCVLKYYEVYLSACDSYIFEFTDDRMIGFRISRYVCWHKKWFWPLRSTLMSLQCIIISNQLTVYRHFYLSHFLHTSSAGLQSFLKCFSRSLGCAVISWYSAQVLAEVLVFESQSLCVSSCTTRDLHRVFRDLTHSIHLCL